MPKIFTIAATEIRAFLRTKAFIVSMLLIPLMSLGSVVLQKKLNTVDSKTRTFAVIDLTPDATLFQAIEQAARERDREISVGGTKDGSASRYVPVRAQATAATLDAVRLDRSNAIRRDEIFAFIELPANLSSIDAANKIAYHSDAPTYGGLRSWLEQILTKEIHARRYRAVGVDSTTIDILEKPITTDNRGLWQTGANGEIRAAESIDKLRLVVAPTVAVVLLFMLVMVTAPQLLQAIQEEKASRISEVLLGSATPFQLMMGKLIGGVVVSLLLAFFYVTGILSVTSAIGLPDLIPPLMMLAFVVFLILAMATYGAIFLAIGAACNDAKSAQSMVMPVVLIQVTPILMLRPVIESPGEPFAIATSLFPLTTPSIMLVRIGLHPAPPVWQVLLSIVLTTIMTIGCVWAAGRIFRVGLLLQGKSPSVQQMARWIFASS